MRTQVKRAFTLIEILIVVVILGILAAIVIPQFTDASQQANTSSVQSQLQTIRSQIELYRVKNAGADPASLAAGDWTDLTQPVDGAGDPLPPFLHSAPKNPLCAAATATSVAAAAGAGVGWVWRANDAGVMDIFAVDAAGAELDY
jgi:general secretion pathway protein G